MLFINLLINYLSVRLERVALRKPSVADVALIGLLPGVDAQVPLQLEGVRAGVGAVRALVRTLTWKKNKGKKTLLRNAIWTYKEKKGKAVGRLTYPCELSCASSACSAPPSRSRTRCTLGETSNTVNEKLHPPLPTGGSFFPLAHLCGFSMVCLYLTWRTSSPEVVKFMSQNLHLWGFVPEITARDNK